MASIDLRLVEILGEGSLVRSERLKPGLVGKHNDLSQRYTYRCSVYIYVLVYRLIFLATINDSNPLIDSKRANRVRRMMVDGLLNILADVMDNGWVSKNLRMFV